VALARRARQRLPGRPAPEAELPLASEAPPSPGEAQLPATGTAAESSAETEAGPQAGERPEA
ncbi:MAG TPA: 30S ribosomal protein S2, partial [Dehalococcoidia bacterium]|nr:30S ribosomal protein S2 [Dehalococcoidia bacterium]